MEINKENGDKLKRILEMNGFGLILATLFIFSILGLLIYTLLSPIPKPCPPSPLIWGDLKENSDGTYTLTVTNITDYDFGLKHVDVVVLDTEGYFVSQQKLTTLLNNGSSNITFYDTDNDYAVSKGDVFLFKGDVIEQRYKVMVMADGRVAYAYDFGERAGE